MDLLCNYVSLISTAYRLTSYRKSNTVDLQVTALSCPIHLIEMHFPEDETLVVDTDDIPERGLDSDDENKRARFKCWPVFGRVNPDLLVCKAFYFLFYGAYGSLFPLLAVYFKQLGLSPFEIGILIGIRPFVEFCAAPVWGGLADTYKKAKFILLLSLFSWLVFTEAMAFVQPEKPTCIEYDRMYNDALLQPLPLQPPQQLEDDVGQQTDFNRPADQLDIQKEDSGDDEDDKRPSHYNMKYTRKTFLTLLFLVIVGEFFCSPTHTLTDSATLSYLGREKMKYYGRQRMFGSLGWGISMLAMGVLLDRTSVTRQGCETEGEVVTRNYFICFGSFAVLITAAFVVATQIRFRYHGTDDSTTELSELKQPKLPGVGDTTKLTDSDYGALHQTSPEDTTSPSPTDGTPPDSMKDVLRMYGSIRYGSVLFVAWFAGFGMGLLFAFLYWHLEELGSPALLFGLAAVVNHSSEVFTYFFSHTVSLYLHLFSSSVQFQSITPLSTTKRFACYMTQVLCLSPFICWFLSLNYWSLSNQEFLAKSLKPCFTGFSSKFLVRF